MKKSRVMIVDDQVLSRRFFELMIGSSDRYEVALAVESAFSADIYLLESQIDLIVMDVLMSDGSNGLDAAERIKRDYPQIKIVLVTSMPEQSWMARARAIGVESFWYKESEKVELLNVIDRTMAGESVYPENAPPVRLGNAVRENFSDRELDVLREIAAGKTNTDIAKKLFISENTVKSHLRVLLQKTGYKNRTELAIHARVVGIALDPKS